MSAKPFKCKNCPETLEWPDPYVDGCRPLEVSTQQEHICAGLKKNSGKPFTSAKFPITDYMSIYDHAESILSKFKEKRKDVTTKLTLEEEAIFIESMFRSLVTGFKP